MNQRKRARRLVGYANTVDSRVYWRSPKLASSNEDCDARLHRREGVLRLDFEKLPNSRKIRQGLQSRFSANEHRNALTLSPKGCARDRASRRRHRGVPFGDRKAKAAKRRLRSADRAPFLLGAFLWVCKEKYLAQESETQNKMQLIK